MDSENKYDNNFYSTIKLELNHKTGVCRTCMCRGIDLKNIYGSEITNICERIQFCTGLKFLMEDPLPSYICNVCLDNLTVAYNFKSKCIETDRTLWSLYSTTQLELSNLNQVYIRENERSCHKNYVNKGCILTICDDDINSNGCGEQKNVLSSEKDRTTNESNLKNTECSSRTEADKSSLYNKCISQLKTAKRTKFRRLYCESCNIRFESKQDSDKHKKTVHKDEPWVCQHCGKSSTKKSAYYYHMNSHFKNDTPRFEGGGKPPARGGMHLGVKRGPYNKKTGTVEITDCGGSAAKTPRRKFKLNKQFCEKCDVRFENDEEFIAHKRDVHKHVYLCEICGRVFYNRDARFSHMTSHEQPKFACDHCDYTTTRKQDLIKHLYIHNGVKSYQCEYCPLSFYTASNLRYHHRRHRDGPHVCGVCGKRILDRYSFKRHMDTHNGSATTIQFACQLCGSCFRRSWRLNQHMLKRHNVRTPPQRPGRRRIEPRAV